MAAGPARAADREGVNAGTVGAPSSPTFMRAASTRASCPHRVLRLLPETTSNGWTMLRTLTTVLVVLALGCGSSNGGSDRPTFAAMCSSAGAAINQVFVTCWKANPDFIAATNPLSQLVVPDCADLRKAIDAGRVTYDASSAQACLAALGSCGILTTFTPPAACRDALKGAVPNGGTCYTSTDCQNVPGLLRGLRRAWSALRRFCPMRPEPGLYRHVQDTVPGRRSLPVRGQLLLRLWDL
jgi:hypothetical protein